MAKEQIIKINTAEAIKSIGDLKKNISEYKKSLEGLDIGSKDYIDTLTKLQQNQAALRNAMYGTSASLTDVMNAATAANVAFDDNNKLVKAETLSYNELVRELAILKQEWRATSDAAERARLGERINNVNNQLKTMDKSVGVFGRNVGNYMGAVDHLVSGLQGMGKGAQAIINPLKGATAGFATLSATPAVAILGLLATVIQKVIDGLKSSEENTMAMTKALAPLKALGDAMTITLQQMGKALVKVAEWFGKLTSKIIDNNEAVERRIELAEREKALTEAERQTLIANAEAERDVAELRAKAADKVNYTAKERIAFLEQAGDLEKQIAERAYENAKARYDLIILENSATENSTEAKNKEAEAYAAMIQAQTAYFEKSRSIVKALSSARKEAASEAAAAAKAVQDAAQKEAEAFADLLEQIEADTNAEIEAIGQDILAGMDKEAKAAEERTKKALDAVADGVQKRQAWNEVLTEDERQQQAVRYEIQMEGLFRQLDILQKAREEALSEGYIESLTAYETQIADIKEQIELESARRSKAIREQDLKDAKKTQKQKLALLKGEAGAVADIMDALADIYEANGENDKRSAQKAKGLRIATTIIDTLSGAVAAFKSGVESGIPAPYNMILAASQAAAVTVAGMANVAKIKATNVEGGGSGSSVTPTIPAAVEPPTITPEVNQVRNITSASEEDRLNQMASDQRVYILSSDLEADRNARRTEVAETTF